MESFFRQIVFLGLFLTVAMSPAVAQQQSQDCDLEFDYEVEHTNNGQDNGKIYLVYRGGEGPVTIRIYDTMAGLNEFKETKRIERFSRDEKVMVFENLKASNYMIRIESEKCQRSLTGIEGITIK
jgi:hypothetical protein